MQSKPLNNYLCVFAGVLIGMEETSVFVDEDVGERELCASVMNGTLGKEVSVMVVYENRNAIGMYTICSCGVLKRRRCTQSS